MNRLTTLLAAETGQLTGEIDSEYVLGHHLQKNEISVRSREKAKRKNTSRVPKTQKSERLAVRRPNKQMPVAKREDSKKLFSCRLRGHWITVTCLLDMYSAHKQHHGWKYNKDTNGI